MNSDRDSTEMHCKIQVTEVSLSSYTRGLLFQNCLLNYSQGLKSKPVVSTVTNVNLSSLQSLATILKYVT